MAKGKRVICPHCGESISLNKISKLSRKEESTEFFDIYDQMEIEELVNQKLQDNKIEFGQKERR